MLFFLRLKFKREKIPTDDLLYCQDIIHHTIHQTDDNIRPTNLVLRSELPRSSGARRVERDRNNGILTIHLGCRLLHPDRDWCQHRDIPRHNQTGCRMSREHQEDRWFDHQAQYLSYSLEMPNWQTWLLVWGNFQTILSPEFDVSLIF